MGNENITQLEAKGTSKLSLSAIPRLFAANPPSLYLPIALAYTWQYALVKIWNHFCATPAASLYLVEGIAFFCLALLFALRSRTSASTRRCSTPAAFILAACLSIVPLGVVLAGPFPGSDLVIGIASIGIIWLYPRCGKLFVGLGFRQTIVGIVGSLIVAYLIRLGVYLLPDLVVYPFVCITPLLFEIAYRRAQAKRRPDPSDDLPLEKDALPRASRGFLIALILEFVAFNIVAGFFGTPLLEGYNWIHQLILIGIMLLVMILLLNHGPHVRFGQLFEIALLCCLLVFVVLSLTTASSAVALAIVNVPHNVVTAFLWLLLVDLENRRKHPPLTVFAVGWGISFLSVGVGRLLSASVVSASDLSPNFLIVLAFFLVASVLFVVNKFATYGTFSSYAHGTADGKAGIDYSEIEETCRVLGQEHGLTKREIEIVQLIAKGRSRGYIASSLVISENTVKGHTRNAYSKLGIHSKQELLTLIESK